MVLLWALTFVVLEGLTVQAGGQVASWAFGQHRVVFGPIGAGASIFGRWCIIWAIPDWHGVRISSRPCPDPWPCGPRCSSRTSS